MASEIEICNMALSHIGAYSIQSLSGSSKEARECNIHYSISRDMVLRDHDWGFARKRQSLALLTETYSGWDYAYQYPTDCLIARKIYDETGAYSNVVYDNEVDEYVQVGKVQFEVAANEGLSSKIILTNKEDAELIYTAKATDSNLFDPLFIQALAKLLGAQLAQPIKADKKLKQQLYQEYGVLIAAAKSGDANESYEVPKDYNAFTKARE